MNDELNRRQAFRHMAACSLYVIAPSTLLGCSKTLNCSEAAGLTADELRTRNEVAKYVEQTPDAAKRCSGCTLYIVAAKDQCGGCSVVKGPINPDGYCTLYVAKPA